MGLLRACRSCSVNTANQRVHISLGGGEVPMLTEFAPAHVVSTSTDMSENT